MSADVAVQIDETGSADLVLEAGDLKAEPGLQTAVLVSLFSDARLPDDEPDPPYGPATDPRGWWPDTPLDRHGSLLWLLERAKTTPATEVDAIRYCEEALAWGIEDGVWESVEVAFERGPGDEFLLCVTPVRGTATEWPELWAGELGREIELGGYRLRILTR